MIQLDDEQEAAVQRMLAEPTRAALCAAQYGVGKTVIAVELAIRLGGLVNLIICPVFTRKSWKGTITGQGVPEDEVFIIDSSKAGKQNLENLLACKPGWYIIGREFFRSKQKTLINKMSHKIDFACYDECQSWANHRSAGFALMKQFKPKWKLAMSATPARNRFTGMYAIHQWLWPNMEGHHSFWRWVADWCETAEDFFAGTVVVGEREPGEFVKALPCYVMLEKDFGEPLEYEIAVDLSAKERKIYNEIKSRMIAFLEENTLIVKFPTTKRIRLRQASLGELSYDAESDQVFFSENMKSTKLDTLMAIIKESPDEPMVIFTASQKYASVVVKRMQDANLRAFEWSGAISAHQRDIIKEWFIDGEIDYIVATPASIGEGTDGLQHRARVMVWLDRSDDGMVNEQAFRRLYRRGQTRQVVSISIIAEDTYDRGQLDVLIEQKLNMNRVLRKEGKV